METKAKVVSANQLVQDRTDVLQKAMNSRFDALEAKITGLSSAVSGLAAAIHVLTPQDTERVMTEVVISFVVKMLLGTHNYMYLFCNQVLQEAGVNEVIEQARSKAQEQERDGQRRAIDGLGLKDCETATAPILPCQNK